MSPNRPIADSKLYRALRLLIGVVFWITCPLAFAAIIASIFDRPFHFSFHPSFSGFTLVPQGTSSSLPPEVAGLGMLLVAAYLAAFWLLKEILDSLEFHSPFVRANIRRIRAIGWILLAAAYLNDYVQFRCVTLLFAGSPDIRPFFNPLPTGAILALFALVLAEIFRFGGVLQREHDTTV